MYVVMNNLFFIGNLLAPLSRQGQSVAHHDTELAVKYLMIAAFSTTCKVGVWHTMKELAGKISHRGRFFAHIGSIQYDRQGRGMACHDSELAGKSHGGCTQQGRQGRGVPCHDTELAGKAPREGQSVVSRGVAAEIVLYKYMDK